jgi:phosphoribosylaminoimidazole-succinocarboxamide synthase
VRRWLKDEAKYTGDGPPPVMPAEIRIEAARRYIASYELVTGKPFVPDTREPVARIAAALGATC